MSGSLLAPYRRQIADLLDQVTKQLNEGAAKDYAEYKNLVGQRRAYGKALTILEGKHADDDVD